MTRHVISVDQEWCQLWCKSCLQELRDCIITMLTSANTMKQIHLLEICFYLQAHLSQSYTYIWKNISYTGVNLVYLWCHLRNLNISDNFFSNMALVVIAKLFVLKDITVHILHPLPKMFIKSLQAFLIRCFCLLVQQHIRCSAWHLDHCTKKQTTTWAAILT